MRLVADARYACTSCGDCCGGWGVPLLPGEAAAFLEAAAALVPAERLRDAIRRVRAGGGSVVDTLSGAGRHCAALASDGRCLVHVAHGHDAKPLSCRLFPLTFVATPDDVRVGLSYACSAVVDGDGPPLAFAVAELTALLAAVEGTPYLLRVGDTVRLTAAHVLPWRDVAYLVDDWVAALRGPGTLVARLGRAGAGCALVVAALDEGRSFAAACAAARAGRERLLAEVLDEPPDADRLSRALLGTLVDTTAPGERGAAARLWGALAALGGAGPAVRIAGDDSIASVPRAAMERVERGVGSDGEALLARWLASELEALTFFGGAAFDLSLAGGLDLLIVTAAAVALVARAHAAGAGRAAVALDDVKRALRQVYAGVHHRAAMPPGFERVIGATASLDLLRTQL